MRSLTFRPLLLKRRSGMPISKSLRYVTKSAFAECARCGRVGSLSILLPHSFAIRITIRLTPGCTESSSPCKKLMTLSPPKRSGGNTMSVAAGMLQLAQITHRIIDPLLPHRLNNLIEQETRFGRIPSTKGGNVLKSGISLER